VANDPTSLPRRAAHRFLDDLAEAPFIALVLSDGDVRVYTKGLDDETMEQVASLIATITASRPTSEEGT
jgi:hypothetical protein